MNGTQLKQLSSEQVQAQFPAAYATCHVDASHPAPTFYTEGVLLMADGADGVSYTWDPVGNEWDCM